MSKPPKPYPSDVSDEEWEFCAPYLTLMKEEAPQRTHSLRQVYNALRWLVRAGCSWRLMPHEFPPWWVVQQQTQRWLRAGCFETMAHDLRAILRMVQDRNPEPTAVIMDSRTMQSTPESGKRAGFDGHKKRKGSKVHAAVDTLGHLLALKVTAANEQDRAQVGELAKAVQEATGENVEIAYVDQGYTGEQPAADAAQHGMHLEVVKHHEENADLCCCPGGRWSNVPAAFDAFASFLNYSSPPQSTKNIKVSFTCVSPGVNA
jgi:transposase